MTDNIRVMVRIRPPNSKEQTEAGKSCVWVSENNVQTVVLDGHQKSKQFTFDWAGGPNTRQEDLFDFIGRQMVDSCLEGTSSLEGYNCTFFAYGQTGAGKTYTMLGKSTNEESFTSDPHRGILQRSLDYLFWQMDRISGDCSSSSTFSVKVSFVEIYNEQFIDLVNFIDPKLADGSSILQIREDIKRGVYLEGLADIGVQNRNEVLAVLVRGLANRHTGATNMNLESSRSHSVFSISVTSKTTHAGVSKVRHSQFHFVDLAGSERQKKTEATGERLKEGCNINRSLSVLGSVINALVESAAGKKAHVRYRDSKLTFLLRDSLGGNSRTAMVANVSPAPSAYHETLSTLQFAQRAKQIKTHAVLNEDMAGGREALQLEIRRLKDELSAARAALGPDGLGLGSQARAVAAGSSGEEERLQAALQSTVAALLQAHAHLQCEAQRKADIIHTVGSCFSVMQQRELQFRTALLLKADQAARSGVDFPANTIAAMNYETIAENLTLKERLWRLEQVKPQFELAHSLSTMTGISIKPSQPIEFNSNSDEASMKPRYTQEVLRKGDNTQTSCGLQEKVSERETAARFESRSLTAAVVYQVPPEVEAELEGMRLDLLQSDEERESLLSSLDYLKDALERQADSHGREVEALRAEVGSLRGTASGPATDEGKLVAERDRALERAAGLQAELEAAQRLRTAAEADLARETLETTRLRREFEAVTLDCAALSKGFQQMEELSSKLTSELQIKISESENLARENKVYQKENRKQQSDLQSIRSLLEERNSQLKASENGRQKLEESIGCQEILVRQKDFDIDHLRNLLQKQQAITADLQTKYARAAADRNAALQQYNALHNALAMIKDALESSDAQAVFDDLVAAVSFKQQATLSKKALCDREQLLAGARLELDRTRAAFRSQLAALKRDFDALEVDYARLQAAVRRQPGQYSNLDCPLNDEPHLEEECTIANDFCGLESLSHGFTSNLGPVIEDQIEAKSRLFRPNMSAMNKTLMIPPIEDHQKSQAQTGESPKKPATENGIAGGGHSEPEVAEGRPGELPVGHRSRREVSKASLVGGDLDVEAGGLGKRTPLEALEHREAQAAVSDRKRRRQVTRHAC
jgi:hypothetical protein